MRFGKKLYRHPSTYDKRVVSWFAILPVRIEGETRWLERVWVRQSYKTFSIWTEGFADSLRYNFGQHGRWNNVEFLERDHETTEKLKEL